jgi:hypothetical protein
MRIQIGGHVHDGQLRFVPAHGAWLIDLGTVLLEPEHMSRYGAAIVASTAVETADLLSLGYLRPEPQAGDSPMVQSLKAWIRAQPEGARPAARVA